MAYTPKNAKYSIATAARTLIVPAPGASEQHVVPIGGISVYNTHASNSTVVDVIFEDGATDIQIAKVTLAGGATWVNTSRIVLSVTTDEIDLLSTGETVNVVVSYGDNE